GARFEGLLARAAADEQEEDLLLRPQALRSFQDHLEAVLDAEKARVRHHEAAVEAQLRPDRIAARKRAEQLQVRAVGEEAGLLAQDAPGDDGIDEGRRRAADQV